MKRDLTKRLSKREREFISNISMFLLTREELRKQFWNIKSAQMVFEKNELRIGISTLEGKLGQTLEALRKVAKPLGEHLFLTEVTTTTPQITFFVDKRDEELEKMYKLLDNINEIK